MPCELNRPLEVEREGEQGLCGHDCRKAKFSYKYGLKIPPSDY